MGRAELPSVSVWLKVTHVQTSVSVQAHISSNLLGVSEIQIYQLSFFFFYREFKHSKIERVHNELPCT